jgi:hypothetical protein
MAITATEMNAVIANKMKLCGLIVDRLEVAEKPSLAKAIDARFQQVVFGSAPAVPAPPQPALNPFEDSRVQSRCIVPVQCGSHCSDLQF